MNELMIFKNEEFGEIRSIEINNEPYFVGKEICILFGDTNYRRSLTNVENEDKMLVPIKTSGGKQNMTVINENIFYDLLFSMQPQKAKGVSQNEQAINERIEKLKKFKRWITHEVLPSIRKTGGYIAGEENMSEDELVLKAMNVLNTKVENLKLRNKQLQEDNEKQNQLIGELKPKADYTDKILKSKGTIKVNVIANDYGFTAVAFNKKLRELGIQYKEGKDWLLYRKYRGKGYTHTKTFSFTRSNGTPDTETNMEWTQKGRLFLYNKLKENGILPMIEQESLFN